MANDDEVIGNPRLELEAGSARLKKDLNVAVAAVGASMKDSERIVASANKRIQGNIDKLNAVKPRQQIFELSTAVQKMGGVSALSANQVARLRKEVDALAAAGAKIPKNLQNLGGSGILGKAAGGLMSGGGVTGALSAIGPAGMAAAAGITAATAAAGAGAAAIASLASKAESWTNIAEGTGLGVVQVQQLQAFLEDAGFSGDDLTTIMKKLQVEIAGGGTELKKFGISVTAIKDLKPEEQLQAIAQAVMAIIDPTERAAAAQAAFGKNGAKQLAAIAGIAQGAYQQMGALQDDQVKKLLEVDAALDRAGRKWTDWKNQATFSLLQAGEAIADFATNYQRLFGKKAAPMTPGLKGGFAELARLSDPATYLQTGELPVLGPGGSTAEDRAEEARKKAKAAAEARAQKEREFLDVATQVAEAEHQIALEMEKQLRLRDLMAGPAIDQIQKLDILKTGPNMFPKLLDLSSGPAAPAPLDFSPKALQEAYLAGTISATEYLDKLKKIHEQTIDWRGALADSAHIMQGMPGLLGKVGGALGGAATGLSGFKSVLGKGGIFDQAGKAKGLDKILGFATGGLQFVSAGIGIGKAIIGLFKGDPVKKAMKEAGKVLGQGISRETAEQLLNDSKRLGISVTEAAKRMKADQEKAAADEKRRNVEEGLGQARGGLEAILAQVDNLKNSPELQAAIAAISAKVQEALLKSGLGFMATGALKDSKEFGAVQAAGAGGGQVLAGMRQAGMVDTGLLQATSGLATELQKQAFDAAKAAGLSDEEARKASFGAINDILREQLNASIASGTELDENTKALLAEAKANGIEIVADPMLQQLAVQKQQLAELQKLNGTAAGPGNGRGPRGRGDREQEGYPAAAGLRPFMTRNVGGGLGPLIQTHPDELVAVIPKSKMGRRGWLIHAKRGLNGDTNDGGGGGGGSQGGGGGNGGGNNPPPGPDPMEAAVEALNAAAARPAVAVHSSVNATFSADPYATKETQARLQASQLDGLRVALRRKDAGLLRDMDDALRSRGYRPQA